MVMISVFIKNFCKNMNNKLGDVRILFGRGLWWSQGRKSLYGLPEIFQGAVDVDDVK